MEGASKTVLSSASSMRGESHQGNVQTTEQDKEP